MKYGFMVLVLAAGLAGCGAEPVTHRNYHEISPEDGMLSDTSTWEWRRKGEAPAPAAAAPATAAAVSDRQDFKKWQESAGSAERKEFDDWRAWQEWKRRNPK